MPKWLVKRYYLAKLRLHIRYRQLGVSQSNGTRLRQNKNLLKCSPR